MDTDNPQQNRDEDTIKRIMLHDIGDLHRPLSGMTPEHIQLGSGRFHGQIHRFNLGSSILNVADYEGPLRIANGAFSRHGLTFLVSMSDTPKNLLNGFEFNREKLIVFPGGCDHHFRLRGELRCVGIEVAFEEINRFAEALHRQEIAPFGQHCVALSLHRRSLFSLRRAVSDVLSASHTNPVWFEKEHNRKRLQEELIIDLLGSLFSVSSGARIGVERRGRNSKRVFKIAEEYIRSHASSDISILDLCIVTNSSKSSLFMAFQDSIGVSPYQFLRRTRLTKAWKLLRSSSKDSTTVASIAMDCGYGHLGRFSAHFKQIFGEYPSETLRRSH